jgi:hypothetical protein
MRGVSIAGAATGTPSFEETRIPAVSARPPEWPAPCGVLAVMSQKSVEIVIGRLATDEALRARFLADPAGTLGCLREGGLELNPVEIEALLEVPPEAWPAMAAWVHPRLQKIALKGGCREP